MASIIEIIQPSFGQKAALVEIRNVTAWDTIAKTSDSRLDAANERVFEVRLPEHGNVIFGITYSRN